MSVLSLLISIAAIIVACLAYQRSGGSVEEMKQKVEDLGISLEGLRVKTADLLNSCEKKLRREDKPADGPSGQDEPPQAGSC
jgi:hypothetical protein